jgi:hypothetical protein
VDLTGLAFSPSGVLYVVSVVTGQVFQVNSQGNLSVFASGLDGPSRMTFDGSGNLYVTDNSANEVSKITPNGVISI